ncbi:MAG: hypothetical protein KDD62_12795, partial [Bdellovibrionales bacterium]|nr:hypothetical protein [Bdellovibrionales bacterium]
MDLKLNQMSYLPLHFFTIVLNGEPFIRYHIEVFKQLKQPWHWHIIEGVAELVHDTGWSKQNGGSIAASFHKNGRSIDGTSGYLDSLTRDYPNQVTVYRKPEGAFWDGKLEMVNAPLENLPEEAILMQIDVDECWTATQLSTLHELFQSKPHKSAAWFWCWYFVGPELIVSTRNTYGGNSDYEWLRAWRYQKGCTWKAHEPPTLLNTQGQDLGRLNPILHHETEANDLIFQHFSYVTEDQLAFKEQYYGYQGAIESWKNLQKQSSFPIYLKNYFPWVTDQAQVCRAADYFVSPL